MKKKIFLFLAIILLGYGFWWAKPFLNIPRVGFKETPTATPVTKKPVLRFSVVGDPESDLENLKKTVEISQKNGNDFIVIVGDLTHVGSKKELEEMKQVLEQGGLMYYVVPGNHDIYSAKKLTKEATTYFQEVFGTLYQKVLVSKDVEILLIDNSDEEKGVGAEQMKFLQQNLGTNRARMTFIFLHQPIYHPDSQYIMGYQNKDVSKQKDELLNILKTASASAASNAAVAVFSGHLHHTSSYEWSGIKMYVSGSINSTRNWQTPRFLEVKVFENENLIVNEVEL